MDAQVLQDKARCEREESLELTGGQVDSSEQEKLHTIHHLAKQARHVRQKQAQLLQNKALMAKNALHDGAEIELATVVGKRNS